MLVPISYQTEIWLETYLKLGIEFFHVLCNLDSKKYRDYLSKHEID